MSLLSRQYGAEPGSVDTLGIPLALYQELRRALQSIRYGTIELVIHDGRVVQLERREKVRFDAGLRENGKTS